MKRKYISLFILLIFSITCLVVNVNAKEDKKDEGQKIAKVSGLPITTYLNVNNISTVFWNQGYSDIDVNDDNSGLVFPKGSGRQAVFKSGFMWGAKVAGDPQVRVGGSSYRTGLQGGKILSPGVAEDPDLDKNRIYRVRPDIIPPSGPRPEGYQDGSVNSEISDNEGSESEIIAQYYKDWIEWPATDGAEYTDVDGNGQYDPTVDIPGVSGADQTIWYVANDLDPTRTQFLYGTNPLGIEMQATIWAYARTGALGNMFFRKYKIINKSLISFDSMYVCMWSDVDLGNSGDDFAGCDTTLSLVYCYNANAVDGNYDPLPPPAVGFDFFQGPIVDGGPDDFAIFNGQRVIGKTNLPMTAAFYFARGDPAVTDPTQGSPLGSDQYYNFFRGKVGLSGDTFVDPNTGRETTFALSGDPVTRTGWIDGQQIGPGDRRIGQASGPFTMAVGDTQEVVVAEIVAGAIPGVDRLSAIGLMKFYDAEAQSAYDNFFDLPVAPPAPKVTVAGNTVVDAGGQTTYYALDKKIVLDWGEDPQRVKETEITYNSKGFMFQGYNIYQLPNRAAGISEAIRVATFDIVDGISKISEEFFDAGTGVVAQGVAQFGNDTGIRRYLEIERDAFSQEPLINGIRYYFAVTAYSQNPDAKPNNLETPLTILTIIPTSKNPGEVFGAEFADTLEVTHNLTPAEGASDGMLYPVVVDPTKLTGLQYKVSFEELDNGNVVWHVDRSDGVRVLANQTNQLANDESPTADGIQFRLIGAPLDIKAIDLISNGAGPITGGLASYEITPAPVDITGAISADWYRDVALSPNGGALGIDEPMQVNGGFYFVVAGDQTIGDHEAAIGRWTRDGANFPILIPNNYEIRFTETGGQAWMYFSTENVVDVPFEIWYLGPNLDNSADDIRMVPWIYDDNENDIFDFKLDHEASGGDNDPYSDWIYFMMPENAAPGEAAYEAAIARSAPGASGDLEVEHLARVCLMNWNQNQGAGGENELPEVGTTFRIRMTIPNAAGVDEFTFTAPSAYIDNNIAKKETQAINVFPNPYYAVNSEEINKYNRFVTFSHLPRKAKIRLFDLAGTMVKVIEKDSPQQFIRWDLANEKGFPVASGLYIAYIELPELGKTKILKLAIIQEQQILDRF
ncbi:MAG: T9SS type A sorting domain-containing protein [Ignavibacteriales bacterium]|nr:T9SS type A sorting domain-containing protein [Ignavibacteriales bacterium]